MIRRAVRLLLVSALLYGSGAHWLLIQGSAWAGMIAARSGQGRVARAVITTFDGRHPCRVCLFVKRGAAPESSPRAAASPSVDFAFVAAPPFAPEMRGASFAPLAPLSSASAPPEPFSPPPNRLLAA